MAIQADVSFGGTGTLSSTAERQNVAPQMRMQLLDPTLIQAPTSAQVVVVDAIPRTEIRFLVDGTQVYKATTDSDGNLFATSIPIPESVGAKGQHTFTAEQTGVTSASTTFTLKMNPTPTPRVIGPDAQAVLIPEAVQGSVRKWVLQDLMPGGLGSYILPLNPTTMSAPYLERILSARHTTAVTGQFHIHEGGPVPVEWTFEGYCPTQQMHNQLITYSRLNRRFYIIDHRNRAWKVAITNVDMRPRLTQIGMDGEYTDWGHDYTITALVYDQEWVNPA